MLVHIIWKQYTSLYMVDLVLCRFILPCRIILHDPFNSARALSHIMNSTGYSQKVMDMEAGIARNQCGKFDFMRAVYQAGSWLEAACLSVMLLLLLQRVIAELEKTKGILSPYILHPHSQWFSSTFQKRGLMGVGKSNLQKRGEHVWGGAAVVYSCHR